MSRLPPHSALLLIDVINDFEFPESRRLLRHAVPAARRLARLKHLANEAGMPVIYVNDNFGRWQSTFQEQIERLLRRAGATDAPQSSLQTEPSLLAASSSSGLTGPPPKVNEP